MASFFFGHINRTFKYSHTVGRQESRGPGFRNPMDLALAPGGLVYVVNHSDDSRPDGRLGVRVSMVTLEEEFKGEFGSYGDGDGQFTRPTSIALDSKQNVFVSDGWLQRISVFDKDGNFLAKWGVEGAGDGQMDRPSGMAFDKDDNLYVVDCINHRIQVFTRDGQFLRKFGGFGNAAGQFNMPWGITVDRNGYVWVADWRNDRVQKLTPDGEFLATFGSSGSLAGEFNRPTHMTVDQDGDIYVTDSLNHRVQVFTPEFRHITSFAGDATMSKWGKQKLDANPEMLQMLALVRDLSPWQRFWYPVAVEVDEHRRIIVVELAAQRIQVYRKETPARDNCGA